MSEIVKAEKGELARPLKVLVPLIRDEIKAGEEAGLEHYRAAGELLVEAKATAGVRGFAPWFNKQGFTWSLRQAQRYMALAEIHYESSATRAPSSLREAAGEPLHGPRTHAPWVGPLRQITDNLNLKALAAERENREREKKLLRDLGLKLIDIGYKVLAAKLHPDKSGGSSEAMARLNNVRNTLREAL